MNRFQITNKPFTWQELKQLVQEQPYIQVADEVWAVVREGRKFLEKKLDSGDGPIYGVNTGFGALCNTSIEKEDLQGLQHNLVRSHACGAGDRIPVEVARLMMVLKIRSLAFGNSGIQEETLQRLVDLYNNDVIPVIYEMGSLGASGDLAPLAHLSLPLIGEGKVIHKGKTKSTATALKDIGLTPLKLEAKEGLALLNGTQFMSAYGVYGVVKAQELANWADLISSCSLEGFDGRTEPFDESIQKARPHPGQIKSAENIRKHLEGSEIAQQKKEQVQDPYSFRCTPQVHGASRDLLEYAAQVVKREVASVTDNPTIFPEEDKVISAGNFHGQSVAFALDSICMACAEWGSISERRTYKLLSGQRNLPAFLINEPGLHSGMMIPQYAAASMVSRNKQDAFPSSVDSIESSNGQEDHVSMGANAGVKMYGVLNRLQRILGIEFMIACQAIEFRRPARSSDSIEQLMKAFREKVSFLDKDRMMHEDLEKAFEFLDNHQPG